MGPARGGSARESTHPSGPEAAAGAERARVRCQSTHSLLQPGGPGGTAGAHQPGCAQTPAPLSLPLPHSSAQQFPFPFFPQSPQDTYASREMPVQQVRCPFCSVQPKFTDSGHTAFLPGKCPLHNLTHTHVHADTGTDTPTRTHVDGTHHKHPDKNAHVQRCRHTNEHTHAHRDTDMCTQHTQAQTD